MGKYQQKTLPTDEKVETYLKAIPDEQRRKDCERLITVMADASKNPPVMWGASMVGFGSYRYRYASGHEGESLRIGFANRAKEIAMYGLAIGSTGAKYLPKLGKYRAGKGCLYIRSLEEIDVDVLKEMIVVSYATPAAGELTL